MGKKFIRMQINKLISYEIQFWEKILYSRLSKGIEKILSEYDSTEENEQHIFELNQEQQQKENQDIEIKEEPIENNSFANQFIQEELSNDLMLKNHAKIERDKYKYKGIYFHKNRWEPSIKFKGKRYYAKGFQSIELAAQAYDSLVYYFYGFEKGLSKFNHIYTDSTQIKSIFELKNLDKRYKAYNDK